MNIAKGTLPFVTALLFTSNVAAFAGPSSALDPYAYIPAPTKEERDLMLAKKQKKVKAPKPSKTLAEVPAEKESSSSTSSSEGKGLMSGVKGSTAGIAKGGKAVGSTIANSGSFISKGAKSIGHNIATAGSIVKEGTLTVGEKMAVVPKKIGEGFKSSGEMVKDGSSGVGEKLSGMNKAVANSLKSGTQAAGGAAKKLATAPAAGIGVVGHGLTKLNPFHKNDAVSDKTDIAGKEEKAADKNSELSEGSKPESSPATASANAESSVEVPQDEADRMMHAAPEATAATPSAIPQ